MPKEIPRILGINPGTRYLGMAVLEGPELLDWGVKVIQGRPSQARRKMGMEIVRDLVSRWQPDILAIKKLHPSRSSANLNRLVKSIKDFCRRKRLKVLEYPIKDLHAFFSPEEKANKKRLAEIVALAHPDLTPELNREKDSKNPYHIRMFEAVALATLSFYKL